jgi:hypothetical protein
VLDVETVRWVGLGSEGVAMRGTLRSGIGTAICLDEDSRGIGIIDRSAIETSPEARVDFENARGVNDGGMSETLDCVGGN